jgi:hypothetical protein
MRALGTREVEMSDQLIATIIGSVTTIIVAAIPFVFSSHDAANGASGKGRQPYPWIPVIAVGFSIVAIVVALWPRLTPQVGVFWAQTDPAYQEMVVESKPPDFPNMYRYSLYFQEPVDVVIPQQLTYTNNWSLWKVERSKSDESGRKWVVSFQSRSHNSGQMDKGHASFVGLSFSH